MGLFDFFKKKQQQEPAVQPENGQPEPYLGDLEKTQVLYQLVQTPKSERDEIWRQKFLHNIKEASFRCSDPQVISGPDRMPYFQLFLPEPNKSFQCYVIDRMKDDFLMDTGYGVVINPTAEGGPDWVLSYGDIVNLHLNGEFYTEGDTPFSKNVTDETLTEDKKVLVGQPSEMILPQQTRQAIAQFLKVNHIETPKVALMMRHAENGKITQDLVFNLTPNDFNNEDIYRSVMQTLGWFLPRHYSFVGMDERTLADDFMPL